MDILDVTIQTLPVQKSRVARATPITSDLVVDDVDTAPQSIVARQGHTTRVTRTSPSDLVDVPLVGAFRAAQLALESHVGIMEALDVTFQSGPPHERLRTHLTTKQLRDAVDGRQVKTQPTDVRKCQRTAAACEGFPVDVDVVRVTTNRTLVVEWFVAQGASVLGHEDVRFAVIFLDIRVVFLHVLAGTFGGAADARAPKPSARLPILVGLIEVTSKMLNLREHLATRLTSERFPVLMKVTHVVT